MLSFWSRSASRSFCGCTLRLREALVAALRRASRRAAPPVTPNALRWRPRGRSGLEHERMRARTNKRMRQRRQATHTIIRVRHCKGTQKARGQRVRRKQGACWRYEYRFCTTLPVVTTRTAASLVSLSLFSPSPVSRYFLSFSNTALWQMHEYVREVVKQRNELEKHDTCNLIARGEVDGTICSCGASVQALPQKVAIE